jgi:3-hydroxyisobutyrate dehydrogenase-like beta-hydroxyacid dehydrogenase
MTEREANPPRVGFVGLGDMGGRIARRIALAGYRLTVFDRRDEAMADLVAVGASAAADIAGLAAASDVVCICVVDDDQVRSVVGQIVPRDGLVVLVHSSLLPQTVLDIATEIEPAGALVIDAPVSGSRPAAAAGTLTVLVGGSEADVARVDPYLRAFGKEISGPGRC